MTWNAERIKKERMRYSLTQARLSKLLGCRQQTISEWENGLYEPTNAYCKLLDLCFLELRTKGFLKEKLRSGQPEESLPLPLPQTPA